MSAVKEKVAYLRGLLAGLGELESEKNQKLWDAVMAVLEQIADELEMLDDDLDNLGEYVDSIDDDLAEVEETVFCDEDDYEEDDDDTLTMECDNCGESFLISAYKLYGDEDIVCPNCGVSIYEDDDDLEVVDVDTKDED